MALGFGVGPVLGGILIEVVGWRSIFAINLLASLAVVVMVHVHVARSRPRAVVIPNVLGVSLGVITLASLTFALIEGADAGWDEPAVVAAAVIAVAAALRFVAMQRSGPRPLLPKRLFAAREVSVVAALGLLFNFTAYAQMFVLSLWFQREWGYSALQSALIFLPAPAGTLVAATRVGPWAAKVGPRAPLALGLGLNALAPVILLFARGDLEVFVALVGLLVAGLAGGLAVPGLNIVVAISSPPDLVGVGTAVLNATRQVGGVLGIAILGSLIGTGTAAGSVHVALAVGATASIAGLVVAATLVRSGPAREGEPIPDRQPELETV
jgi:DHA2 family methylenomycin A resistance protein-like MFS transporter